jgi:hypothetical protein
LIRNSSTSPRAPGAEAMAKNPSPLPGSDSFKYCPARW